MSVPETHASVNRTPVANYIIQHIAKPMPDGGSLNHLRQLSLSLQQYTIDARATGDGPLFPNSLSDLVPTYLGSNDFSTLTNGLRITYHPRTSTLVSTNVLLSAVYVANPESKNVYSLLLDGRVYMNNRFAGPVPIK